jgi:hypothetical protein
MTAKVHVMNKYHWPSSAGVAAVNELLRLPAHGQEQDWEIELADGARLSEFLDAFEGKTLDLEGRSALALLILFSITYAEAEVLPELLERTRCAIQGDATVLLRMRSYWSEGFADHEANIRSLIS